jgi:Holliday junction resolvase RusA-like endonuclease
MTSIEFTVHAPPSTQGSKRPMVSKKGKPFMREQTGAKLVTWRGAIVEAAEKAIGAQPGWVPLDGPVVLSVVFTFARPRSHYGTGKNEHVLKASAPKRPIAHNVGDLSKLIRSTEDALTDAGVWVDDAQVCDYGGSCKVYVNSHIRAQWVPGAYILVTEAYPKEVMT